MTRARIALLGLIVGLLPGVAAAQDMQFGLDEAGGEGQEGQGGEGQGGEAGQGGEGGEGGGDVIGDLAQSGQDQNAGQAEQAPRRTEAVEEIYAVQQVYALRNGRVELSPSIAFTVNDPYVSHPAGGIGV